LRAEFPEGTFEIAPLAGTTFQRVAGDEPLFADGRSREQPYICIVTAPAEAAGLRIRGHCVPENEAAPLSVENPAALAPQLTMTAPAAGPLSQHVARLADIVPWFAAERVRALLVASRPGAVLRRRLGHARCFSGTGRAAAALVPRRADPRPAAAL
jgi:hypothetical protein